LSENPKPGRGEHGGKTDWTTAAAGRHVAHVLHALPCGKRRIGLGRHGARETDDQAQAADATRPQQSPATVLHPGQELGQSAGADLIAGNAPVSRTFQTFWSRLTWRMAG
jgi:hypothetical protein